MNHSKKTKIVCTIGPATWDQNVMAQMIESGMNCARVNGAFADTAELDKVRNLVKSVSNEVSLMLDVKGPEVRMNKFPEEKVLTAGQEIIIGSTPEDEIYPQNYPDLYTHVSPGQRIVVGDGDVELEVKQIANGKMHCQVVYGEVLKPAKALNLPGVQYSSEVLSPKDIELLEHAKATGWDFVSASFIKNVEGARQVNQRLQGSHTKLIAKIEDQEGIDNLEEILAEVEGIMIARGGLGVELGLENVPMAQRKITEICNKVGKPVITATQMLETMTTKPRPTRAEVNDVATAIMLGTDSVMLSGESSVGEYPVEAVKTLTTIAKAIEVSLQAKIVPDLASGYPETDALSKAAAKVCIEMQDEIKAVVIISRTGRTARLVGRHSIKQPVYLFTRKEEYARRIMLSKGINKVFVHADPVLDREDVVQTILNRVKEEGLVQPGEKILFVAKKPLDVQEEYVPNVFEILEVR